MAAQITVRATVTRPASSCIGLCRSLGHHQCRGKGKPASWARADLPALIAQAWILKKAFQCADPWSLEDRRTPTRRSSFCITVFGNKKRGEIHVLFVARATKMASKILFFHKDHPSLSSTGSFGHKSVHGFVCCH